MKSYLSDRTFNRACEQIAMDLNKWLDVEGEVQAHAVAAALCERLDISPASIAADECE
jgi:hypothetical protein